MRPFIFALALLGLHGYCGSQLAYGKSHAAPATRTSKVSAGRTGHSAVALPPPVARKIDYVKDIHPILQESCANCHLNGKSMGGLRLDSRETILKGGKSGPAVVAGHSDGSYLIKLVAGVDPDKIMPMDGRRLTAEQIGLLRAWIDQGLSFSRPAVATSSTPSSSAARGAALALRRPKLPILAAGSTITNPLDRILGPYLKARNVQATQVVDDRIYARRVYLDIIGLLPEPEELQAFIADKRPNKRALLAKRLLADNRRYAEHWLTFWNDALRNDYAGTGYIDGGRQQITRWLYNALLTNKPYNRFVAELVNPSPESEGFSKGIIWRGTVNASQTPPMQAAQNISQVFLGINLKCASCHDSFISDWKLSDAYGMAGIYADQPLEMVRCDRPTGQTASIKFLYPKLGAIDAHAPRAERLQQLAEILTSKRNGRLTRTIVNRLWARFMGRGLIEPLDEMDNKPWSADLLDWLAADLADNGYDLKQTMQRIVTSRAYQMPAVGMAEGRGANFVFRGPAVRRMSAEQFIDAVSSLTGVWPSAAVADISAGKLTLPAKWIWNDAGAARAVAGGRLYLRKVVELPEVPSEAIAVISCDNEFTLYVNGKKAATGDDWMKPMALDLKRYLVKGKNVFAVEAINWPDPITGKGLPNSAPNPAGFLFHAKMRGGQSDAAEKAGKLGSDASWLCSAVKATGWEQAGFVPQGWQPAIELGAANAAPWALEKTLMAALQPLQAPQGVVVRSSLITADALATALGRPNREQVVTSRPSAATTLQALELTNGRTLASLLQGGAKRWMAGSSAPRRAAASRVAASRAMITSIYQKALGRKPTPDEMQAAEVLVGSPAQQQGVEDLLWVLVMLPEFQLIY